MIVNGAPAVSAVHQPVSVLAFVITRSRIVQIYSLFGLARISVIPPRPSAPRRREPCDVGSGSRPRIAAIPVRQCRPRPQPE